MKMQWSWLWFNFCKCKKLAMAKLIDGKFLVGSIGDLRFYQLNGQTIVSSKGGPSAKQIKTKPSCIRMRQNNIEFGAVGKLAGYIKRSTGNFRQLWYKPYYDHLNKLLKQVQQTDSINGPGERNLHFSNARNIFASFQITKSRLLDFTSIHCEFERCSETQLQIKIPEIQECNHIYYPEGYREFEYSLHAICLPDILYDYKTNTYPVDQYNCIKPLKEIFNTREFNNTKIPAHKRIVEMKPCANYLIFAYLKLSSIWDLRIPPIHTLMIVQLV